MKTTYKVSELKKLISESSNEFKAVLGLGVESKDKENNGKAYSDAKKRAKDFDGGLSKELGADKPKYKKEDENRTTLDYQFENMPESFKKRVKAQVKGYTSEAEMNNGIEKAADFSNGENIYNGIKDAGKEMHKNQSEFKATGLQASKRDKKIFNKEEMYESKDGFDMRNFIDTFSSKSKEPASAINENSKTYWFKKTTFLNEEHMFSKIPDEAKNEGSQFKMKDKNENEYLIEWNNNKGKIIGHSNKGGLNESLEAFKRLSDYRSSDSETTRQYRINEGEEAFLSTLEKMRRIIK